MWNQNFMFKENGVTPMDKTENELFQAIQPTLDSTGLRGERYISVWVQGDEDEGKPMMYTNVYARTAILDCDRQAGLLQPYQGRSHQLKALLSSGQKAWIKDWLIKTSPEAWEATEDSLKLIFEED